MSFTVVKVGGSLLTWPDLPGQLRVWIEQHDAPVLIVPGGGAIVDEIRAMDQRFGLGEETAHWMAIRGMDINGIALANQLEAPIVRSAKELRGRQIGVLDCDSFCRDDARGVSALRRQWDVTSDSIAAWCAVAWLASELVLLKSAAPPEGLEWFAAGYVDPWMMRVLAGSHVKVRAVNLREYSP